jgi:hypothetical protein
MGQIIRMPTESDIPDGAVRDFAQMIFYLYKRAHRPSLREVSNAIARNPELAGTASPETIRRILRGTAVPQRWETVQAVMQTLCDLANIDTATLVWFGEDRLRIASHIDRLWHRALDYPWAPSVLEPLQEAPDPTASAASTVADPWASENSGDGFSDEPPF